MTDTNQGFGYRLGRSWTPMGRISAPGRAPYGKSNRISFFTIALFFGFLGMTVSAGRLELSWLLESLAFQLTFFFLILFGIAVDEYQRVCWQTRRLHDLGYSSSQVIVRRLPFWILMGMVAGIISMVLFFEPQIEAIVDFAPIASGVFLVILFLVAPFALFVTTHLYFRHVLKPFNEYLCTTPGNPGPNRYGPAPTD